jgi:molecular chaperone DnaK
VFSTADDNQSAVTIHVLQGERDVAGRQQEPRASSTSRASRPRPRGMPQIEVTFDIDANGILHVSAKDKATGKENKITIKASSGLNEEEIQRMVKDAEMHADEDKKQLETVNARNQAEALAHSIRKSLTEYGDKLDAGEKEKIEAALKDLEGVMKNGDKETIEAKTQALASASQKLGEKIYADAQAKNAQSQAGAQPQPGAGPAPGEEPKEKEVEGTVVDAEYTEVKDKKSA